VVLAATGGDVLVTDTGSTKNGLVASLGPAGRARFIGGHPVAGGERGGVGAARADLFAGATWFLTPAPEARGELFQRLHALVGALGAQPVAIAPEVHDRLMALVSHLPHVLASALIDQAADTAPEGREALRSAGPSFADLTRVAGANPPLWADILLENRDALLKALEGQAARLGQVAEALRAGDRAWVRAFLERAAAGRARLRTPEAPVAAPWGLVVRVPNRVGVLSEVATVLGHAHINIEDLELRPARGDAAGELALVVAGEPAARQAEGLLSGRGFRVRVAPRPEL
jgi:prephenate dehydrogenase